MDPSADGDAKHQNPGQTGVNNGKPEGASSIYQGPGQTNQRPATQSGPTNQRPGSQRPGHKEPGQSKPAHQRPQTAALKPTRPGESYLGPSDTEKPSKTNNKKPTSIYNSPIVGEETSNEDEMARDENVNGIESDYIGPNNENGSQEIDSDAIENNYLSPGTPSDGTPSNANVEQEDKAPRPSYIGPTNSNNKPGLNSEETIAAQEINEDYLGPADNTNQDNKDNEGGVTGVSSSYVGPGNFSQSNPSSAFNSPDRYLSPPQKDYTGPLNPQGPEKTSPPRNKYVPPPIDDGFSSASQPIVDSYLVPPKADMIADYAGVDGTESSRPGGQFKETKERKKNVQAPKTSYLPPVEINGSGQNFEDDTKNDVVDTAEAPREEYGLPLDLDEDSASDLGSYGDNSNKESEALDDLGTYTRDKLGTYDRSTDDLGSNVEDLGTGVDDTYSSGTESDDLGTYGSGTETADDLGTYSSGTETADDLGTYSRGTGTADDLGTYASETEAANDLGTYGRGTGTTDDLGTYASGTETENLGTYDSDSTDNLGTYESYQKEKEGLTAVSDGDKFSAGLSNDNFKIIYWKCNLSITRYIRRVGR